MSNQLPITHAYPIGTPTIILIQGNFLYVHRQWEMPLHYNVISHWLGAYTKWSLIPYYINTYNGINPGRPPPPPANPISCCRILQEKALNGSTHWPLGDMAVILTHTRPRDMARSRPPFWIFSFAAWKWVNMDGNWRNFDGNISSYV